MSVRLAVVSQAQQEPTVKQLLTVHSTSTRCMPRLDRLSIPVFTEAAHGMARQRNAPVILASLDPHVRLTSTIVHSLPARMGGLVWTESTPTLAPVHLDTLERTAKQTSTNVPAARV